MNSLTIIPANQVRSWGFSRPPVLLRIDSSQLYVEHQSYPLSSFEDAYFVSSGPQSCVQIDRGFVLPPLRFILPSRSRAEKLIKALGFTIAKRTRKFRMPSTFFWRRRTVWSQPELQSPDFPLSLDTVIIAWALLNIVVAYFSVKFAIVAASFWTAALLVLQLCPTYIQIKINGIEFSWLARKTFIPFEQIKSIELHPLAIIPGVHSKKNNHDRISSLNPVRTLGVNIVLDTASVSIPRSLGKQARKKASCLFASLQDALEHQSVHSET